ncbi:EF-P beta-lysylation protein EpmB [Chromatium weissei]|nr:EF-P beta-lysylation protein EpmB [Chromatium weissei]
MVTRSLIEIAPAPPFSKEGNQNIAFSHEKDESLSSLQSGWRNFTVLTEVTALLAALELDSADIPDLDLAPAPFRLLVPSSFVALMQPGHPHDPLLRQVLPLGIEQARVAGYVTDPVNDAAAVCGPGLLRKYTGRALLMTTTACALHCRYCFRRHLQAAALGISARHYDLALAQIAEDNTLTEIILSGGDPLLLDDAQLEMLFTQLAEIAHLKRLRIHTRLPTLIPARITPQLCTLLAQSRLTSIIVIHVNHAQELGQEQMLALQRLRESGVTLLNQSVLLRGVNDDCATLAQLSERLFDCGVLPYYLHQLDPVAGAAHFQISDANAIELRNQLRAQLPGYLVPRLVREISGAAAKYPL